jgi:hypothetical protein
VEPREHPAEQAQPGLLTPAVRLAIAFIDASRFLRQANQGEKYVAHRQGEDQPLHPVKVADSPAKRRVPDELGVRSKTRPSYDLLEER